jgi:hypothetical protein
MKAEHRHELKTNELAEWIANFPQWAKDNLKVIIYVSVVLVLVAGSYFYRRYQNTVVAARKQQAFTNLIVPFQRAKIGILQGQAAGIDNSYKLFQTANRFRSTANEAKNDHMAALALIKQAEVLRTELHYRVEPISEQEVEDQINRAKAAYKQAIEKSSKDALLRGKATFGVGLCEEELGNFELARQIYNEVVADANFANTVAAAQAKNRLATISDYQQEIVFKPAPPRKAEVVQPLIQPAPVDINLPVSIDLPSDTNLPSDINLSIEPE